MTFRVGDGARTDELTVTDIGTQGVTPAGASQEIMRQYAFLVAYTFVPSRGCWEMRATVGEREHKVVVEVK